MTSLGVARLKRICKLVIPKEQQNIQISSRFLVQLDQFLVGLIKRIVLKAVELQSNLNKKTVDSRSIQTAVRLIFKGELIKHAVSSGQKFVIALISAQSSDKASRSKKAPEDIGSRVESIARHNIPKGMRFSRSARAYLSGVIDYVASEIGETAWNGGVRKRISEDAFFESIQKDCELNSLVQNTPYDRCPEKP